jgi:tetratricopeptide (TPR) repeat protein
LTRLSPDDRNTVQILEAKVRQDPTPANYYNLGVAYGRIGSFNLELSCYERAISLEGPRLDTVTNLFSVLESLNDQRAIVANYWRYRSYVANHIPLLLRCLSLAQKYEHRILFRSAINKLRNKLPFSQKLTFLISWLKHIFSLSDYTKANIACLLNFYEQALSNESKLYEPLSKIEATILIPLFSRTHLAYINCDQLRINSIHLRFLKILLNDAMGNIEIKEALDKNVRKPNILFISVGRYNVQRFLLDQVSDDLSTIKPDLLLINNWNQASFKNTFNNVFLESASDYSGLELIFNKYSKKYEKIYFDEVGMSIELQVLSAFRWDGITYTSWLHPVTTGAGGVDFYVASERIIRKQFERFSEQIVTNGALGIRLKISPSFKRKEFSQRDYVLIGSIQNPNKYLPEHDCLYTNLLKECPSVQLNFLLGASECTNRKFIRRISLAMQNHGITKRRFGFTPYRPRQRYLEYLTSLDAIIDTPFWSGGNTTLDAIECGVPIFCLRGESLRGGHSASILETLGQTIPIATTQNELINLISNFSSSPETRKRLTIDFRLQAEENYNAFNESTPTIQDCLERHL